MSKAAELAALIGSQTALSNRNLVINGAMQVAQRGTSTTGLGANANIYSTVDRWRFLTNDTAGRYTLSQSTDAPDGFGFSTKIEVTTADTSIAAGEYFFFRQLLEGQDLQQLNKGTSAAKQVTVSFYVKGNANATYLVELEDADNSRLNSQTFDVTTSWTRVVKTFTADTTGELDNDNANSFNLGFWLHAGSTYTSGTHTSNTWAANTAANRVPSSNTSIFDSTSRTFFITGVQLEVGEQATPFEHRSFSDELARCQRYFLNYADVRNNYGMTGDLGTGSMYNASTLMCCIRFPVEMRAAPTMTHGSGTSFYQFWRNSGADQFDGWSYWYNANRLGGALQAESNISGTAGHAGRVVVNNSAGDAGYIHLDAEL